MTKPKRDKYGRVIMEPDAAQNSSKIVPPPIRRGIKSKPVADSQYDAPTIMAASSSQRPVNPEKPAKAPVEAQIPASTQNNAEPSINADLKTRLYRPADNEINEEFLDQSDFLPVGWLVVIGGPGLGKSLPIGYGWNKIGRDPNGGNRIVLDFGDATISSANHARINCNIEKNTFKIAHQDGINNTYVDGEDLDSSMELNGGERIRMGETELIFVRFCGPNFSWG